MNQLTDIEGNVTGIVSDKTDSPLDSILRQDLIRMLKDAAWYSGGRSEYGTNQGYSLDVREETALRDVNYRDEPLYKTAEYAIAVHWRRHYQSMNLPANG